MNKKTKFGIFLLVTTLVILIACKSTSDEIKENKIVEKEKIPSKPVLENGREFTIEYKDGKVESIIAASVIWSETKDIIYFKGSDGENIKEIPKSLVSNVK